MAIERIELSYSSDTIDIRIRVSPEIAPSSQSVYRLLIAGSEIRATIGTVHDVYFGIIRYKDEYEILLPFDEGDGYRTVTIDKESGKKILKEIINMMMIMTRNYTPTSEVESNIKDIVIKILNSILYDLVH